MSAREHAKIVIAYAITSMCLVSGAKAETCDTTKVVVDVSLADTIAIAFQCRGQAQVVQASDTLVAAITVWSPPRDFMDYQPRELFLTGVINGQVDVFDVFYGPEPLVVLTRDPSNPIAYRYDFDPPLSLVGRVAFGIVIQAGDANAFALLASSRDVYPGGGLCKTGPVFGCAVPGAPSCIDTATWDLCFSVEYCSGIVTAAHKRTWGSLMRRFR